MHRATRIAEALASLEEALMELGDYALAQTLRELDEWFADMKKTLRERRLRSSELQDLLKGRCAEVRVPGPDARGPFCLILVGLENDDMDHVVAMLGDGYSVKEYYVGGDEWVGPPYWHLGVVLEGLQGQSVHIAEVQS